MSALPPTWRAGIVLIVITLLVAAAVWFSHASAAADIQLPTL